MFASQSSSIHFYTILEDTFTSSKLKVAIIHLHGPYQRRTPFSLLTVVTTALFLGEMHWCWPHISFTILGPFQMKLLKLPVEDRNWKYFHRFNRTVGYINNHELEGSWPYSHHRNIAHNTNLMLTIMHYQIHYEVYMMNRKISANRTCTEDSSQTWPVQVARYYYYYYYYMLKKFQQPCHGYCCNQEPTW